MPRAERCRALSPLAAKNGECTGDNADHLATLCPHSCATCTITCKDTEDACGSWAKEGHCKSNSAYMLKACPTSCGLCSPVCQDVDNDCPGWTASGACGDNPEFMLKHCPVSCGVCRTECKDTHDDCPGWVADGACHKNPGAGARTLMDGLPEQPLPSKRGLSRIDPLLGVQLAVGCGPMTHLRVCTSPAGFVLKTCAASCEVCDATVCDDKNSTQCEIWGEAECANNPGAVMRDCPK